MISNDYLIDALKVHPHVGGLASEELDDFTPAQENGEYLVLFDPLDGSSNIDINMCVGTIFSILPAKMRLHKHKISCRQVLNKLLLAMCYMAHQL